MVMPRKELLYFLDEKNVYFQFFYPFFTLRQRPTDPRGLPTFQWTINNDSTTHCINLKPKITPKKTSNCSM